VYRLRFHRSAAASFGGTMVVDRRNHYRLTYYCEAQLEGLDVGRVPCRLADISVGGAFIEARTVLPVGARAAIRFSLGGREIVAVGEVRYSAPGIGMGLRFIDLPETEEMAIRTFVLKQGGRR
jgi:hypothetical protein